MMIWAINYLVIITQDAFSAMMLLREYPTVLNVLTLEMLQNLYVNYVRLDKMLLFGVMVPMI